MDAARPNPLISSQKSSQLQAVLHPLVLLTISDYITRHTLRESKGPIVGALLGQHTGREITIEHAFECLMREADVEGGYLLDATGFSSRLEQMVTVHKERNLDLVGWYTLLPATGPSPTILPIHTQLLEGWNESAVVLGFHPEQVLNHSVGGKLPLTIYESNYEVDDHADGEDRKMDDGEASPSLRLKFREVPYSVETDETEMISMNYVAGGGGSAAAVAATKEERPARSIESNGKGKRRLVEAEVKEEAEAQEGPAGEVLTREEDEMLASLTARVNAIKMLHSRIHLITAYLERLPPDGEAGEGMEIADAVAPSLTVLRQVQALVNRLDLVIPSDREAFEGEMRRETNNVHLVGMLNSILQGVNEAKEVGRKFGAIESAKTMGRRGQEFSGAIPFTMPSTGDIMI